MTLGTMVADLKKRVGPGVEVTDDALAQWVNNNYMYMVDEIVKVDPDHFTTPATADIVAGQQEYDLPSDFDKAIVVNVLVEGTWVRATPLPIGLGDAPVANDPTSLNASESSPVYYIQEGKIGLFPLPSASVDEGLQVWYVYTPEEMEDDDEPAFSAKYHALATMGAYADYLDQNDEHGPADATRNRFERRVESMVETIDDSDLDSPKSVVVTHTGGLASDDYI